MRLAEQLTFMNKFKPWADRQRLNNESDASAIRALAKYNGREFWQKDLIDSYIDGRLSVKHKTN